MLLKKMFKGIVTAAVLLSSMTAYAGTITGTGTIVTKTMLAKTYAGSRERNYKIYVPQSYNGAAVPMVVALHGCGQNHDNVLQEWNLELLADQNNFILVTPFITTYDGSRAQNCWGFWFDHHIHKGAGEVEDVRSIAREVEAAYQINPNRRYLVGLSSGGGMTVAGAVAHNTYWAAAAASAGLAYGETQNSVKLTQYSTPIFETPEQTAADMRAEMGTSTRTIPLMVMNSENDNVVVKQAALNITAAHLIVWGSGKNQASSTPVDCSFEGVSCTHKKWTKGDGSTIIEQVLYNGNSTAGLRGHYWVGDDTGTYSHDVGPVSSRIVWDFLKTKTLDEPLPCTVNCDVTPPAVVQGVQVSTPTENSLTVSWTANVEADLAGYEIYQKTGTTLTSKAKVAKTATSVVISGLASETSYTFVVKAYDTSNNYSAQSNEASGTTLKSSAFVGYCGYASNYAHISAGRAYNSGGYAYAKGSNQNMGLANTFYGNYLKETASGYFIIVSGC